MGSGAEALRAALNNPPLGCKDQGIKDETTALVVSAMAAVRDNEIAGIVNGLSPLEVDVLMKYVYRGLEDGENSTSVLKWHAEAYKKGGLGCIVRAMAERRTV
eukprot:CAMPEP_0174249966 /NCGR_PEP_ID=MMETSP0439-20130205/281_1 /TAXON_ID=0 /ORGANISM="Stereomyxa ramosa, Strain Chinc5" /LENGTH=102 /DNA_ID=CAMNT_0015329915 /DNA_START=108 /DNA_END=416 /DNA_ORIENTATION=+